jgi:hypothetical protein
MSEPVLGSMKFRGKEITVGTVMTTGQLYTIFAGSFVHGDNKDETVNPSILRLV